MIALYYLIKKIKAILLYLKWMSWVYNVFYSSYKYIY